MEDFDDLFGTYHELVSNTYSRQSLAIPHSEESYKALAKHVFSNEKLLFVVARRNEEMLSAGIFLIDGDRIVFHSGSSTLQGNKLCASSAVQWFVIKQAMFLGLREYDFGGTGFEAIDKFKKSFGGEPVDHHRWGRKKFWVKAASSLVTFLASKGWLMIFS